MFLLVLLTVTGLAHSAVHLPQDQNLAKIVDRVFKRLDHNPNNGIVTESEWDIIATYDDQNSDGCVTMSEFEAANAAYTSEVADALFKHFDHNNDTCLKVPDMQAEYHMIDQNNDDSVNMQEWETYFTNLVKMLFGTN